MGEKKKQPEEQFDMYGEIVCQDCWDYNMYQALQDGSGMQFYNYIQQEYMCNTRKKQGVLWLTYSFFL